MDRLNDSLALSNMAGSASLACWIVLLLPQLIEQWRTKSAEGISLGFLVIWFLGDITNLVGSLWAHLLPQVVLLAVWYCIADSLLLLSYVYYKQLAKKRAHRLSNSAAASASADPENEPLLSRRDSANKRRSHSSSRSRRDSLTAIVEHAFEDGADTGSVVRGVILPVLFVVCAGIAGLILSPRSRDVTEPKPDPQPTELGPQILGYISALLYLGARIPQIIQNHTRRSVYGLSLLFFVFSTLGNVTYALQILLYSSDWDYIMLNMPWLLGSLGTVLEDVVIFVQFYIYRVDNQATVDE